MAISGVEIALWDLAGKAIGVPICQLLGGKYRDRLRLYPDATQGMANEPESWNACAKQIAAEAYTIVQFNLDGRQAVEFKTDPYSDSITRQELRKYKDLVRAARDGLGDDVDLAIQCHGKFDASSALHLAEAIAPFDIFWIGNPVPPENIDALAEVSARSPIPICVGGYYYKKEGFRELLARRACDILNPTIHKAGGLMFGKVLAAMAEMEQIPVAYQSSVSPVGMIAAAQLAAATKNFVAVQTRRYTGDVPWYQDLVDWDKPLAKNGYLRLPEGPGLGVELNEEVARAHLKPGTGFFESVE
jgi:L-alanine-DL-glutamate epimerase-like enolase superfamily enzyme